MLRVDAARVGGVAFKRPAAEAVGRVAEAREEGVGLDSLFAHGGLFKTPVVGQKYMAAACHAPVTCMQSAGEGGPYGMALLASYMVQGKDGETLEDYLADEIFAGVRSTTLAPDPEDAAGFDRYLASYRSCLAAEKAAVAAF